MDELEWEHKIKCHHTYEKNCFQTFVTSYRAQRVRMHDSSLGINLHEASQLLREDSQIYFFVLLMKHVSTLSYKFKGGYLVVRFSPTTNGWIYTRTRSWSSSAVV